MGGILLFTPALLLPGTGVPALLPPPSALLPNGFGVPALLTPLRGVPALLMVIFGVVALEMPPPALPPLPPPLPLPALPPNFLCPGAQLVIGEMALAGSECSALARADAVLLPPKNRKPPKLEFVAAADCTAGEEKKSFPPVGFEGSIEVEVGGVALFPVADAERPFFLAMVSSVVTLRLGRSFLAWIESTRSKRAILRRTIKDLVLDAGVAGAGAVEADADVFAFGGRAMSDVGVGAFVLLTLGLR